MKLVSINIEGNRHLDRVIPFIDHEQPDVLCMQEVLHNDRAVFEALGYRSHFLPITRERAMSMPGELGVALFTKIQSTSVSHMREHYFSNRNESVSHYNDHDVDGSVSPGIIFATVTHEDNEFTVGTTHFTWAPDGSVPSQKQEEDLASLLSLTETLPPHLMCGDFNLPRHHNPLYDTLVEHYSNAVPETYSASMDKALHQSKDKPGAQIIFTSYMVDHLLLQPPYNAQDVRLQFELSDHAAIVATITREI